MSRLAMASVGRAGSPSRPCRIRAVGLFTAAACLLSGCTLFRGPRKDRTEFFTLEAAAQIGRAHV